MLEEDLYQAALGTALRKLKARDRFESEVREFLAVFPAHVVDRAITFLKERRIIDDTKSTINLVERYSGKRSIGIEKLRFELNQRGAPEETINKVLSGLLEGESVRIDDALRARFSPEENARTKAARFLYARGFSEEAIESALDRFFQG